MTKLYRRPGGRVPIYWEPDQTDLGKQAVEAKAGPVDNFPADVTEEQAAAIREEYARLLNQQTSGGSA